jgi:PST family polysaccharide transporter
MFSYWRDWSLRRRGPLASAVWLGLDRATAILVGGLVGAWIARSLGPSDFGSFSSAQAVAALWGMAAALGFEPIARRELARRSAAPQEILPTLLWLRIAAAALSAMLAVLTALFLPRDPLLPVLVAILSLRNLCQAFEIVRIVFECRMQVVWPVCVAQAAMVVSATTKVLLVLSGVSLGVLACAAVLESALTAAGLIGLYRAVAGHMPWARIRIGQARSYFVEGWTLMLSALAVAVYVKIDQLMVWRLAGAEQAGVYAAAARLYEPWFFLPGTLLAAFYASLMASRSRGPLDYDRRLTQIFCLLAVVALSIALPTTCFAPWMVDLLFGRQFAEAAPVLMVLIWALVFVFHACVVQCVLVTDGRASAFMRRTACGTLLKVAFNSLWIPRYGALGAALATVVSYAYVGLIGNMLSPATWPLLKSQLKCPLALASVAAHLSPLVVSIRRQAPPVSPSASLNG